MHVLLYVQPFWVTGDFDKSASNDPRCLKHQKVRDITYKFPIPQIPTNFSSTLESQINSPLLCSTASHFGIACDFDKNAPTDPQNDIYRNEFEILKKKSLNTGNKILQESKLNSTFVSATEKKILEK